MDINHESTRQSPPRSVPGPSGIPRYLAISGAGSGLGHSLAMHFLNQGSFVACIDLENKKLEDLAALPNALAVCADISAPKSARYAAQRIEDAWDHLDCIIPCAGISGPVAFSETSLEEWNRVIEVNLSGAFMTIKTLMPLLSRSKSANIVFVGSISGHKPLPYLTAYRASKAGVLMLMHCMASLLGPEIRVNAVSPGPIMTPMQEGIIAQHINGTEESADEYIERRISNIPLRRFAEAADVIKVVEFLMSDTASFLTGQEIVLDGGEYQFL